MPCRGPISQASFVDQNRQGERTRFRCKLAPRLFLLPIRQAAGEMQHFARRKPRSTGPPRLPARSTARKTVKVIASADRSTDDVRGPSCLPGPGRWSSPNHRNRPKNRMGLITPTSRFRYLWVGVIFFGREGSTVNHRPCPRPQTPQVRFGHVVALLLLTGAMSGGCRSADRPMIQAGQPSPPALTIRAKMMSQRSGRNRRSEP